MAVSTDPNTLSQAAACYSCIPAGAQNEVIIYLLNQILGTGLTVQQLLDASACMKCIPGQAQQDAITYLLCQIANGGKGGSCAAKSGSGSPVGSAIPQFIGQLYHNTTADTYYRSTGLTSADWVAISGGSFQDMQVAWTPTNLKLGERIGFFTFGDMPGITKIQFLGSTSLAGFDIDGTSNITEIDFPNLASVDPLDTQGGYIQLNFNSALATVSLPLLASVSYSFAAKNNGVLASLSLPLLVSTGGDFAVNSNALLASINLPSVVTIDGDFACNVNPSLTSVNVPSWVPNDGSLINLAGCALSSVSVQLILRRCVLAGVTTCTIDLSGGTSAGTASLNAQGQADVVTLGAQLTINP